MSENHYTSNTYIQILMYDDNDSSSSAYSKLHKLLEEYYNNALIMKKVYTSLRHKFVTCDKLIKYPTIILASTSVFSNTSKAFIDNTQRCEEDSQTFSILNYMSTGIAFVILILSGINNYVEPSKKGDKYLQLASEFSDISMDIRQFVAENKYNMDELRFFTNLIKTTYETWLSIGDAPSGAVEKAQKKHKHVKIF